MDGTVSEKWAVSITTEGQDRTSFGILMDSYSDNNIIKNLIDEGFPIISDRAMHNINVYVNFLLRGSIAVFGVVNNIVNMIIFSNLGLKDSMSVGLMALSFTDFAVNILSVAGTVCVVWDAIFPNNAIDPKDVNYVSFGWFRDIAFLCSGWITTLLSIERCVCVVFPFKVKLIFTKLRCFVIVIVIYVINIGAHMPVFLSQWLAWTQVELDTDNGTVYLNRLVVKFSESRAQIHTYIDIANGAVLPIPSQVLVLISVVWLIVGLNVSSRVRTTNVASDKDDKSGKKSNLSSREARLVKVVLLLAIILPVCSIPRTLAIYAKQIIPEISYNSEYGNLYALMWNLAFLATTINSSVNIFVYMIVNDSYRRQFKDLFKRNNKTG